MTRVKCISRTSVLFLMVALLTFAFVGTVIIATTTGVALGQTSDDSEEGGLSDALRAVLQSIEEELGEDAELELEIANFLTGLDEADQEELNDIAGDDGTVNLSDVQEALGVEDEGDGVDGDEGTDGEEDEENLTDALREVLEAMAEELGDDEEAELEIAGFLEGLEDADQEELNDIAGDDETVNLSDVRAALGAEDDADGDEDGEDGDDDEEGLITEGNVAAIDLENSTFSVETEEGELVEVVVQDHTQFFVRLKGSDRTDTKDKDKDKNTGTGGGGPGNDNPGGGSGNSNPGGGNRPSKVATEAFFQPELDSDEPVELSTTLSDLKVGDEVKVDGPLDPETGAILADRILITRSLEDQTGLAFPAVSGVVEDVDQDAGTFNVREGKRSATLVIVSEGTEFLLRIEPLDENDGNIADQSASFDDLLDGDHVRVFGERNEERAVDAARVVIFRQEEPEAPVVVGRVVDVDREGGVLLVEDQRTEETWTVLVGDETEVIRVKGDAGQSESLRPDDGGVLIPQDISRGKGNSGRDRPKGKKVAVALEEFEDAEDVEFSDTTDGLFVAVFGEETEPLTVEATRIVILFEGVRQGDFLFTDKIDLFDRFGGRLSFQNPEPVSFDPDAEFTLPDGTVLTLAELKEFLADNPDQGFFLDGTTLSDLEDPEFDCFDPSKTTESEGGSLLCLIDARQILEFDNAIRAFPKPTVQVNRLTELVFADESEAAAEDLTRGTRVEVSGTVTRKGRQLAFVADIVRILGGRPFRDQGRVASVDIAERTITFGSPDPVPIDRKAKFGNERGRRVSFERFNDLLNERSDLQVVVKLSKFDGSIRQLQILDPSRKKNIKKDERLISGADVTIEVGEDGGLQLVFAPPLPIFVPEGLEIQGDVIENLEDLEGKRVIVDGEQTGEVRTALRILVIKTIDAISLQVEVGDFDGEGSADDILITVLDQDDVELALPVTVFLDKFQPEEVNSGEIVNNLRTGRHKIRVQVPSIRGLEDRASFLIRAKPKRLTVASTVPADGETGVDPEVTSEVLITFTEPIKVSGEFVHVTAFLKPGPRGGLLRGGTLLDDGVTVAFPAEIAGETTYSLRVVSAVGERNQALTRPISSKFSTGGTLALLGSITGTIDVTGLGATQPAATKQATVDWSEVGLSGEVIAVDADGEREGQSSIEEDGSFTITDLPEGDYTLFVTAETTTGSTSGFLDTDGDGAPDVIGVTAGDSVSGIAIGVVQPEEVDEVEEVELISAAASPVTIDLDATLDDQGLDFVQGEPGGEFTVAVYLEGPEGLFGVDLLLETDPTAVTFVDAVLNQEGEPHLLEQNEGFVLSIPTVSGGFFNLSAVILGASEDQMVSGKGPVGFFTFRVNEGFSGTTDIVVTQLVLESSAGTQTLQPNVTAQIEGEAATKQIIVSSDVESIAADGIEEAILTAELLDLEGLPFTDDNSSDVTFVVSGGDATVNGEESVTLTASGGKAKATLAATGTGTVSVRVSTEGASSALVEVEAPEPPEGPVVLDGDLTSGDQGQRRVSAALEVGETITLDLAVTEGILGASGFQVTLEHDPALVEFDDFEPADVFEGAAAIPVTDDGVVTLAVVFLGTDVATKDSGSLGTLTLNLLAAEETSITIVSGQFAIGADQVFLDIGSGGATAVIGKAGADVRVGDIDGDGFVGFLDFVSFGTSFLSSQGDAQFIDGADLDGDGTVSFFDFVAFSLNFNKNVSDIVLTKPVLPAVQNPNGKAELNLVPTQSEKSGEVDLLVRLNEADEVGGFSFKLTYDPSAMAWLGAEAQSSSLFTDGSGPTGVAIEDASTNGEVVLSDVFTADGLLQGEGDLVRLKFRLLDETMGGRVEIAEAFISDGLGRVRELVGAHAAEVRALPDAYALNQNFPNPFNPVTQIAYQLPEASEVTLRVYNILGQEVRLLMEGRQEAGYYRIQWDGRDTGGRSVSSGLYFVRMAAEGFGEVKKMMLLK